MTKASIVIALALILSPLASSQQTTVDPRAVTDCAKGQVEVVAPPIGDKPTPDQIPLLLQGRDIQCDVNGLIVHRTPDGHADGGDTAQREGWYWLGVWIRQKLNQPLPNERYVTFQKVITLLEPGKDGVFYRHPTLPCAYRELRPY